MPRAAPFLGTLLLLGAQSRSCAGGGGANLAPGMQHCGETMPVRPRATPACPVPRAPPPPSRLCSPRRPAIVTGCAVRRTQGVDGNSSQLALLALKRVRDLGACCALCERNVDWCADHAPRLF